MNHPRLILKSLAAPLMLATALTATAAAQQAPPRPTFAERVEVRVINLEAVVVDKDGRRIRGLGPEDFVLEVDGREVGIEFFSEIADGLAALPGDGEEPPAAAPGVGAPGERVPTSYLVFIDSYFTRRAGQRNRILEEVEKSLARLGPNDRMAVVAFDGRRLEVLSSWTSSPFEVAEALEKARRLPARGFITGGLASELDRALEDEEAIAAAIAAQEAAGGGTGDTDSPAALRADGLPTDICAIIRRQEARIERAVSGVTAALRSFAQPPGRKVMMLMAGGWPHSAKAYLVGSDPFTARECPEEGPRLYRPIFETANRLGYTLYPVDVPGQEPTGPDPSRAELPDNRETEFTRGYEVHATLYELAAETGGTALIDGAAEEAFETLVDDTRSYYWIGFTPEWKGDDETHRVELKVRQPGFEVRTRKGYVDLSREAEISYVTESALLTGHLPGSTPLGLELGKMSAKGRGKVNLPVKLTIPMDAITMVPVKRGFAAELELRVAVVDEAGNRNEMPIIPVVLSGPEPAPPGAHAIYETSIKIRREPHDVVISLYDPLSDRVLAAATQVAPR